MDFLSFALDLVAAEMQIPRENLAALERRVRREQGGDRHYIASVAALECCEKAARVAKLAADGVPSVDIADRMGLSKRRVNQILAAGSRVA